jgi:tRNA (Thr-GGU) A37 N-methylase
VTDPISLVAVGVVAGGRRENVDDAWAGVEASIVLGDHVPDGALAGLEDFSHLEVITLLDRATDPGRAESQRRPRGIADLPLVGVLAQRHKDRLGRIGLSRCELVTVHDRHVVVRGLDAIDGTPVLDLKPWFSAFGPRGQVVEPDWVSVVTRDYF